MCDLMLGSCYECVLANGRRLQLRCLGIDDQGEIIVELPVGSRRQVALSRLGASIAQRELVPSDLCIFPEMSERSPRSPGEYVA